MVSLVWGIPAKKNFYLECYYIVMANRPEFSHWVQFLLHMNFLRMHKISTTQFPFLWTSLLCPRSRILMKFISKYAIPICQFFKFSENDSFHMVRNFCLANNYFDFFGNFPFSFQHIYADNMKIVFYMKNYSKYLKMNNKYSLNQWPWNFGRVLVSIFNVK